MKPEFKIFVDTPTQVSSREKRLSKNLTDLIKERFSESRSLSNQEGIVYIGIFFNRKESLNDFSPINNVIFYKTLFNNKPHNWLPFEISLKAGLKLVNTLDFKNIVIVISDNDFTEEELFAINGRIEEEQNYSAVAPMYSLEDVIMNDSERETILRSLAIISERKLIFEKWGFSKIDRNTKSILCFHGAAGTGKTMCAHAVAKYLNKKILIGSYSQIQSKFVGEGEKNLVAYFNAAKEQDAVLFIDEADTFLSRRLPSSNENSKHYNSMSNELYTLIENFDGCIVFASNHIKDFDPAVISRIIEPVEFKLPDDNTRELIIKKMIPVEAPILINEQEMKQLVITSKGFSGRDIRKAVLIFFATAAYQYKICKGQADDDIRLTFDDILSAFNHVKKNKKTLDNCIKGVNINSRIVDASKKNLRIMQVAALALWADGEIHDKEKTLFEEISRKFDVEIDINDRKSIPAIEDICDTILSKTEKIQMLDIACRMIAADGKYSHEEKEFIENLTCVLGLNLEDKNRIGNYILMLINELSEWGEISNSFNSSEYEMLAKFKEEFSEGAAWYKLGQCYKDGTSNVIVNERRSQECFKKALILGYKKAEKEITR